LADNNQELLEDKKQLLDYFNNSVKPKEKWLVGCEYEKFIIGYPGFKPLDYHGKESIGSIFQGLSELSGWEPEREKENIIALYKDRASVTLEPGGQVELSGKTFSSLHDTENEVKEHISEIKEVTDGWKTAWFACGMNPFVANEEIPWMPKQRYEIMRNYLITKGHLSHKMMKQTCTIQVNLDYSSEADAMKKLRVANGVNTIVSAIFANSPIYKGQASGFMTEREQIWKYTDPDRCGIIKDVFSPDYSFADYAKFALNNRMFLIKRENKMIDMTSITFKDFMDKGYQGYRATTTDWAYHLSTVFPEVRLLRYIELRGTDSQTPELYMSIGALWKGIIYHEQALDAAWELVKDLSYEERRKWHDEMCTSALQTKIRKYKTSELARELYDIAFTSLKKQNVINEKGQDESIFLEELYDRVIKPGKSPAETLMEKWDTLYDRSLDKLLRHYSI